MKLVLKRLLPFDWATVSEARSAFSQDLKGQRGRVAGVASLGILSACLELIRPWPVKFVIDEVILGSDGAGIPFGLSRESLLVACCALVLGIAMAIGGIGVVKAKIGARVGRKITTRVRRRLFQHLHRLALPFHNRQRSGDLVVRLMGDVNMVRDLLFGSFTEMAPRVLILVGSAAILFALSPQLAFIAILPLPFLVVGLRPSSRKLSNIPRKQRRKEGATAALAAEALQQIHMIKAFAAEDRQIREFTKRCRSGERAGGKAAREAAAMSRTAEWLTGAGIALVLFFGGRLAMQGSLTPGELVILLSYTRAFYKPVRKLAREGARIAKATACVQRLLDILNIEPEQSEAGVAPPPLAGEIEFRNVTATHDEGGELALNGLTFHVSAGSLTCITGPNGAGKSTSLGVLLRLIAPTSGCVLVDGHDIQGFRLTEWRERIAYVPQQSLLLGISLRENILYGRPEATEEDMIQAASLALVDEFVDELPDGYDTVLGERGATISGGEARRVALARAALCRADILLLDEPLAGLDPHAAAVATRAIQSVARGRTCLLVHHGDLGPLKPDCVIHVENGQCAQGAQPA